VNRISSCYTQERFFPDWKMGFYNLEEIADLDFFKLRSCLKTFQDINSIEDKKNLAKYALQIFIELKANPQVLQTN
ncbi:hypothetical protein, partial [uncultured Gimesia sp.]|uniref:hypothetical protein n=1 Tax=uncultured Gimesia sp. TaxID=1678688 RepID=UPI0026304E91